jgi:hypothetical protein
MILLLCISKTPGFKHLILPHYKPIIGTRRSISMKKIDPLGPLGQKLRILMSEEIAMLDLFCEKEAEINGFIHQCDWRGLSDALKDLAPIGEEIERLDRERHCEYESLREKAGEAENSSFYQVILKLIPDDRDVCGDLYRRLKLAVLKIQGLTLAIDSHVRTISGTIHGILNDFYPHRRGKLYSRGGGERPVEDNAVVINHKL